MTFSTRRRTPLENRRARGLRQAGNMAEAMLWDELKARKLGGFKFVRQFKIGPFYADFACRSALLVVELDGSQHAESEYDRRRDEFMSMRGYSVLRFWSHEAVSQLTGVCDTIHAALDGRLNEDVVASDLRFVLGKQVISQVEIPRRLTHTGRDNP